MSRNDNRASWSSEEVEILRNLYPTHNTADISRKIGRSTWAIQKKANSLGVRKSWRSLEGDRELRQMLDGGAVTTETLTGVKTVKGNITTHLIRGG